MVALVVGPEQVEATREDGGARGTEVSRRRWSIETNAMEPSERPARRNLRNEEFEIWLFWHFQTCYKGTQRKFE